jgi:membrane protease YdiL (CAAX protease family)
MSALWWRLALLGLIGTVSLLLAPFERLAPMPMAPILVRLLSMIQPAILVLLTALLGCWAAPRVGFDAPVVRAWAERRPIWPALRPQLPAALAVGLAAAAVLVGFWIWMSGQPAGAVLARFEIPIATRLLYGGIVEELLLRWGLMSLFVWLVWRLTGARRPVPAWCIWAGLLLSSLLFAIGHLPVLYLLLPAPSPALVAVILGANAVPGILFGLLFWRRGLEAAMMAHAAAHLFSFATLALL